MLTIAIVIIIIINIFNVALNNEVIARSTQE